MLTLAKTSARVIRVFNIRVEIGREQDAFIPMRLKEPLPSGPAKGHKFTNNDINKRLDDYYEERGGDNNGN